MAAGISTTVNVFGRFRTEYGRNIDWVSLLAAEVVEWMEVKRGVTKLMAEIVNGLIVNRLSIVEFNGKLI